MTEKKFDLEEMLKDMGIQRLRESVCHCGTCEQAYDAARKETLKLLEHQCPAWVAQIAFTMLRIAELALANGEQPLTRDEILGGLNLIDDEMCKRVGRDRAKILDALES